MANPNTAHEPSMEEILASIRQIISEDGDSPAVAESSAATAAQEEREETPADPEPQQAAKPAEPAPRQESAAMAPANSAPPARPTPPAQAPAGPDMAPRPAARQAETTFAEPSFAPQRQAEPTPPRAEVRQASTWNPAPQQRANPEPQTEANPAPQPQAVSSQGSQAPQTPQTAKPLLSAGSDAAVSGSFSALAHTILAQNARTLEDLVSEMLRPMLQEWLDDNLPGLVERLVKEEIDRVSRGRR